MFKFHFQKSYQVLEKLSQKRKSTGVLLPNSGVSRRIAMQQKLSKKSSQSESNLTQIKKRNPFANSDESESEDDFVDFSELPPLPHKSISKPHLQPKQKINKTESALHRIDQAILAKYR